MKRNPPTMDEWKETMRGHPALIVGRGHSRTLLSRDEYRDFSESGGKIFILTELVKMPWLAKLADVHCYLDETTQRDCAGEMDAFEGAIWTRELTWKSVSIKGVSCCYALHGPQFMPDLGGVWYHGSSAHFAVQIAWLAGCDPIWVVGVDLRMCPDGSKRADDIPTNTITSGRGTEAYLNAGPYLQFKDFAVIRRYLDTHENETRVYKTSEWSHLPLEHKPLGEKGNG